MPGQSEIVIGFQDVFVARARQSAIPDQYAQAARGEVLLVNGRDGVDDAGQGEGVGRPAPAPAVQRKARRQGAIDVRELVGLDAAAGEATASEQPQVCGELLLQVEAESPRLR